jgi:2-iminobutanoate/2-iminopropanoate deaminase
MIKRLNAENAPSAIGPYCHATIAGGILYSSGQIPLDPQTGEVVSGGIKAQTEQVMKNITQVLEAARSGWDQVLKTTIFLTNMEDFPLVNEIYADQIGQNKPARSTIEVSRLPKDVYIEIDCIALVPKS